MYNSVKQCLRQLRHEKLKELFPEHERKQAMEKEIVYHALSTTTLKINFKFINKDIKRFLHSCLKSFFNVMLRIMFLRHRFLFVPFFRCRFSLD